MKNQRGFLTLDTAITLGVTLLIGSLFLGTLIPTLSSYQDSVAISQHVETLTQAAKTAYKHDTLTRRCLSSTRQVSIAGLLRDKQLKAGDYQQYTVSFSFMHHPYPVPKHVKVTVTFANTHDKNRVSRYLDYQAETDTSLTFITPINPPLYGFEYLDPATGCYQ
jgi:hypothetical protein